MRLLSVEMKKIHTASKPTKTERISGIVGKINGKQNSNTLHLLLDKKKISQYNQTDTQNTMNL